MPLVPILRRQRQVDFLSLRTSWPTKRVPVQSYTLKKQNKQKRVFFCGMQRRFFFYLHYLNCFTQDTKWQCYMKCLKREASFLCFLDCFCISFLKKNWCFIFWISILVTVFILTKMRAFSELYSISFFRNRNSSKMPVLPAVVSILDSIAESLKDSAAFCTYGLRYC